LSVVADQVGAPTSARFIADATARILAQGRGRWRRLFEDRGGVVHLACSGFTSWHGFAEEIFGLARERGVALTVEAVRPIPSTEFECAALRPLNSRLDCTRVRQRFELRPPPWQAALLESLPLEGAGDATPAPPAQKRC
jgi:dTDP-4-dehydrorhamnose reductase